MPAPIIPWVVGALSLGLLAVMRTANAAEATLEPVEDLDASPDEPKFSTQPVAGGGRVVVDETRPVILNPGNGRPPEVLEPVVGDVPEFDAVSPGLPVGTPPKVKKPQPPIRVIPPDVEEVIEETVDVIEDETGIKLPDPGDLIELPPEVPGFGTQPVEGGVDIDIPDVIDLDDVEELPSVDDEVSEAESQLALTIFQMVSEGPAGRASKASGFRDMKAFQAQEEVKVDGIYGTQTALQLIPYGFVPPHPWAGFEDGKRQAYNAEMRAWAKKDPQRAEEWLAATV